MWSLSSSKVQSDSKEAHLSPCLCVCGRAKTETFRLGLLSKGGRRLTPGSEQQEGNHIFDSHQQNEGGRDTQTEGDTEGREGVKG